MPKHKKLRCIKCGDSWNVEELMNKGTNSPYRMCQECGGTSFKVYKVGVDYKLRNQQAAIIQRKKGDR